MLKTVTTYLRNIAEIAFPNNCLSCQKNLLGKEETICDKCLEELPETNYFKQQDNPTAQLFWGRCDVEHAAALFYVNKHNSIHHLIHQLKYFKKTSIGECFGKLAGTKLLNSESLFRPIDVIMPVPLHWKKEKVRGYNQSLYFAKGISEITKIPIDEKTLIRTKENISQTRKTKYERWENVDSIFETGKSENIIGKHLLLVDDVITTGATLEACIHALKKVENVKVSIFSIATAGK